MLIFFSNCKIIRFLSSYKKGPILQTKEIRLLQLENIQITCIAVMRIPHAIETLMS